jgi:hypothetical protein
MLLVSQSLTLIHVYRASNRFFTFAIPVNYTLEELKSHAISVWPGLLEDIEISMHPDDTSWYKFIVPIVNEHTAFAFIVYRAETEVIDLSYFKKANRNNISHILS